MELDKNAFGWAGGIMESFFVFLAWLFEVAGMYGGASEVVGDIYPGFGTSVIGLVLGLIASFITGYVLAYFFAWVYNSYLS